MRNLTVLILLLISVSGIAQDKIVKKSGAIINCEVTEMGAEQVKYHYKDKPGVVFGVDNELVAKVEFESGEVVVVANNSFSNPEYYAGQGKHALKLNFLSPLSGSTEIVYEQSIKPGKSWEVGLGIIGLGFDPQERNPAGAYGKFAFKFTRSPDFYLSKMHYAHILKGAYIAPEIALRYTKFDTYATGYYSSPNDKKRDEEFAFALNLKFGKQWVFDDSFLVDIFWGIGYGYSNNDNEVLNYGFLSGNSDIPISITSGLRVGWVF